MATVLVAWELGGGLGHLVRLLPVVRGLRQNGHRVFVTLKDLSRADSLFGQLGVSYLQAPIKTSKPRNRIDPPRSFAHILHNCGFGHLAELGAMAEAWRNLYELVKPDLILFDHSPTALLAARTTAAKRAVIGTGFCCPPDQYPLPDLRPWLKKGAERLAPDEDRVLETANRLLASWQAAPLERLSQLYHQVDETFLATFAELDHYPHRADAEYYGAWPNAGGAEPQWPEGKGKKVFAYLKGGRYLPKVLNVLNRLPCRAAVYVNRISPQLKKRFQSDGLRFQQGRLDLEAVGRQCDLVIHNGGHGTTGSMLLAGKPQLLIPVHLEQALTGKAVTRLGAGRMAQLNRHPEIAARLTSIFEDDKYAQAAAQFAARFADYDPDEQIQRIVRRIEELC